MRRTVAIVQARMASTRLPGKVLLPLCGRPLLGLLVERLRRCPELDAVIIATSERIADDPIESLAHQMQVTCFRGSEGDVLRRFVEAIDQFPARAVVRICADNPLTDPESVSALIRFYWCQGCDYAYNNRQECGLPEGVGAEVMSADALRRVDRQARQAKYREHVTLFILENPEHFRIAACRVPACSFNPHIRLDVDYSEDLHFVQRLCELLPPRAAPYWTLAQIADVLRRRPDLLELRHQTNTISVRTEGHHR